MKYLSPTATISVWPRKSLVFDATRGWQFFTPSNDETWKNFVQTMSVDKDAELAQSLADFLADSPIPSEEPTPAVAIRTLDTRYNGWLPQLPMDIEQYAGAVALWNQQLRVTPQLASAPMSLPGSAGRLAHLILRHCGARIYFDSDPNALAYLLTHSANSSLRVTHPVQRIRLEAISEIEENGHRVTLLDDASTPGEHDFALGYASTAKTTIDVLQRLIKQTKPGASLGLISRRPHDHWLHDYLKKQNIKVTQAYRDLDTWLIPEGFSADHTADLLILERPEKLEAPNESNATAFNLKQQPYTTLDLNQLGHDRLTADSLEELAELLDGMGPHEPCHQHIQVTDELISLSYYDSEGYGLVLDLRPEPAHASITFMPYHPMLERAAIHAAFLALAGPWTRLAAERTWWSGADSVFT
jgi:hypothetical protein